MFYCYFDESGIHGDAKIFVMAAYLAPQKEWIRFVPKWSKVLSDNGISVFHANECNSNKKEFRKFKDRREERNQFVAELLRTISERNRIIPFLVGLVLEDLDEPFRDAAGMDETSPYYLGMVSLLTQLGLWMSKMKYPQSEKVVCVFDRQNEFSKHAIRVFNKTLEQDWEGREHFSEIDFNSREKMIPLQAADALAYDSYREFCRRRYHPERPPRPSYALLSKGIPGWIWDTEQMQKFIEQVEKSKESAA